MRILSFLHSFEPGGVEQTALKLCAQWHKNGLDVSVMLGRKAGCLREQAPALNYCPAPDPGFSTAWFETLWMVVWLPGIIRRNRPDILFCPGNSYTVVAVVMKLLLGRGCPPIVAKISNDMERPDMMFAVRFFYHLWCLIQGRLIDRWMALSEAMAAESAIFLGLGQGSIGVVPDAVFDAEDLKRLECAGRAARSSRQKGRRFLAAGRLVPQKNFGALIEAFAQGGQPDDSLVIAGEGPLRHKLARRIRSLGLEGRVSLPGHCLQIDTLLASCDVLVLSSRYEGFPAIIVEAIAAGTKIIATDCCASLRPLVGEPLIGTIVPTGAIGTLALAIALARPLEDNPAGKARASAFQVERAAGGYHTAFSAQLGLVDHLEPVPQTDEEFA